jgi:hypothetical protein
VCAQSVPSSRQPCGLQALPVRAGQEAGVGPAGRLGLGQSFLVFQYFVRDLMYPYFLSLFTIG